MSLITDLASGGLTGLFQGIGTLAKDIRSAITGEISPEKKAEITQKAMEIEFASNKLQTDINLEEAKHTNVFVAGWRPAVGWICAFALGYNYILSPLILWAVRIAGRTDIVPPVLDIAELMTLLTGMLGFGIMRTIEKNQGTQSNH